MRGTRTSAAIGAIAALMWLLVAAPASAGTGATGVGGETGVKAMPGAAAGGEGGAGRSAGAETKGDAGAPADAGGGGPAVAEDPACTTVTGPSGVTGFTACVLAESSGGGNPPTGARPREAGLLAANAGNGDRGLLPFTGFGLLILAAVGAGLVASGLEARRQSN